MSMKAITCWISFLICGLLAAAEPPPMEVASVELRDGKTHHLQQIEIYSSAEGDVFWYTDPENFTVDVSFADVVELRYLEDGWHITLVRTVDQLITSINNYRFRGVTMKGEPIRFYLKDVARLRFVTVKIDKICPLGHIWLQTDFLYCPYDGMELEIRQEDGIQLEDRTKK